MGSRGRSPPSHRRTLVASVQMWRCPRSLARWVTNRASSCLFQPLRPNQYASLALGPFLRESVTVPPLGEGVVSSLAGPPRGTRRYDRAVRGTEQTVRLIRPYPLIAGR
jgi:hypothetical protein